jgi:hypothetical protein
MKKLLSMLLVLALALCTLTGCAQVQDILAKFMPEAHAHEYSDKWSSDETNHWHAAICEAEGEGVATRQLTTLLLTTT